MATKAELEAELAQLKKDLAAMQPPDDAASAPEEDPDAHAAEGEDDSKPRIGGLDWALSQLEGTELEHLVSRFAAEVEDMHEHKPLMTLFGAFLLGYVLGRTR